MIALDLDAELSELERGRMTLPLDAFAVRLQRAADVFWNVEGVGWEWEACDPTGQRLKALRLVFEARQKREPSTCVVLPFPMKKTRPSVCPVGCDCTACEFRQTRAVKKARATMQEAR
jgi:hypothetical protein